MSLSEWLTYIAELHTSSIDLGLSRVAPLAQRLQLTKFACPVVMVAGTNGKGSVVRTLEQVHLAAGLRVAAYTSPHLMRFNERLRLNNQDVEDVYWERAFAQIEAARGDCALSFFEFTTLAALLICQAETLDLLILEVGLGGRLDAVNVVEPDLAVVTNVDIDHVEWLGDTRDQIAVEKAGIFRAQRPVVCGDPDPPAPMLAAAQHLGVAWYAQAQDFACVSTNAGWQWRGPKQTTVALPSLQLKPENVATALMATQLLGLVQDPAVIAAGVAAASLPGRYEVIQRNCPLIFDVAHNPQSAQYLASRFRNLPVTGRRFAVVGMLRDKDIQTSLSYFSGIIDQWFVGSLSGLRGTESEQLRSCLNAMDEQNVRCYASIAEAFTAALAHVLPADAILVFGSFHTVAEAKRMVTGDV